MIESFILDNIQRQLRALQISRDHKGISTAAVWANSLRTEGSLTINSFNLDTFLQRCAVNWWPTANVEDFPPVGAMESTTCQPFVTARINEIASCDGQVYVRNSIDSKSYSVQLNEYVEFRSVPVDGHSVVTFSDRQPDIPCYNGMQRGGCSITLLGDVKGCGPRNQDFSEVEVGHILDMGTDLMTKEQFTRMFLFCFLTDGYRFQFFRCSRSQQGGGIMYEQSAVYGGEHGWQVCCDMCVTSVVELNYFVLKLN